MSHILLLDDDEDFRESMAEVLERNGHTVFTDSDGVDVLEHLHALDIEIVITDVVMPEQDGIKTLMEIKRNYPDTSVVVVSGGGRIEAGAYLRAVESLQADAVLRKPVSAERLLETVARVQDAGTGA